MLTNDSCIVTAVKLAWSLLVLTSACTAAVKTSTGGAYTKPGVEGGTSRSVYIGDRGGVLTRVGMTAVGGLATMGSISSSTRSERVSGGYVYRTDTISVDVERARQAQEILDAANDWSKDLTHLQAGLEIAARDLGGDTSGWMFDFGQNVGVPINGSWGLRGGIRLEFGRMTFHDRKKRIVENLVVREVMEDSTFAMFGIPTRMGLTFRGVAELFFQADLNLVTLFNELASAATELGENSSPSPWHAGARITLKYLYAEAVMSLSALDEDRISYGLEAGFAF